MATLTLKEMFPKKQKLYTCDAVASVIDKYVEMGGEVCTLEEGVLGYGLTVCFGDGLKTCVITEVPLNCWSSGHKVRFYNEMPRKYEELIERAEMSEGEN